MQHSYARRANPTAAALAAIPFEPDAIRADLKAVRMAARVANAQTLNLRGNEWRNREKDLYRQLEKASDSQIKWIAKSEANYCRAIYSQIMLEHGGAEEAARVGYAELFIYVDTMGIKVPDFQKHGFIPACNRMMCETWWRRRLRVKRAREIEAEKVRGFEVSDRKETYVSDRTLERRRAQRDHNARLLKDIKAVNQQGDEYTLHDLAALSVSNPTIRRMELMTRIAGFERFANSIGFKAGFFTLTCPSRMHSNNAGFRVGGKYIPGKPNPNYDGTTPKQAQEYLSDLWAKARAALDRRGFIYFGFRVVEPHHDATPHWHMLFFMPRKQRFQIAAILRKYALQVDGNEKGADKHRFKFEDIKTGVNPATGREYSAAGYIAKYISKAIDGYAVGEDLYGNDAQKAAERIEAWASTWGIRQFQQIGGPSVTVWRELRRLRDEEVNGSALLEKARAAANAGDWAEYCRLNWHGKITLLKQQAEQVELNKYGDEKQMSILGVQAGGVGVVTRLYKWEIGGAAATAKRDSAEPWTCVNNCTEVQLDDALKVFYQNWENKYRAQFSHAVSQGFSTYSAMHQVKRVGMAEILAAQYGIKAGAVVPDDGFMIELRKRWHMDTPRELLLEEFEDSGGGDLHEFTEEHFSEFCRNYLWMKYGVEYEQG